MTREAINELKKYTLGRKNTEKVEISVLQLNRVIKALEQEPKTIQEKQAESEKYQKAFDDGYENGYAQARFDYEQEPCEDAISRDAVKELIKCGESTDTYDDVEQVCKWIDALPSVTQKSGHWMEKKHNGNMIMYHRYKCSVCDEKAKGRTGIWVQLFDYKYNYCPNCGAKMESEE